MSEIASMLITHKKAGVAEIERWGASKEFNRRLLSYDGVSECAILKTCNRAEVYVVSPEGRRILIDLAEEMGVMPETIDLHDHDQSLRHLLRLASGLESMIIGEDQILGQMKELYSIANGAGCTGVILNTAFKKAIHVGKRVRAETKINEGAVSIASATITLASGIIGDLSDKDILVVGAGKTGEIVGKSLAKKGAHAIYVANRTFENAKVLANILGGLAIPFKDMEDYLRRCDLVISATAAPHVVIHSSMVERVMRSREKRLLMIDIANPRDIEEDVGDIPGVELYNIDGLREIGDKNMRERMKEIKKAEIIVDEEMKKLRETYMEQKANEIIAELHSRSKMITEEGMKKAVNRLCNHHLPDDAEIKIIRDLTRSITKKLLSEPTLMLKKAAKEDDSDLLNYATRLFGLNESS
jgi:glutamyl-tRNA reductase